jgi:hypothetical protein
MSHCFSDSCAKVHTSTQGMAGWKGVDILGPDMEGEYTEWPQGLDL